MSDDDDDDEAVSEENNWSTRKRKRKNLFSFSRPFVFSLCMLLILLFSREGDARM